MATNTAWGTWTRPVAADAAESHSTAILLRRLVDDLATLLRQELALATAELSRSIDGVKTAIGAMAGGGAVIFAALLTLIASAVMGLSYVLPGWLSALIIGLVVLAIGVTMLQAGKKKLSAEALTPKRTQASLRRDSHVLTRREP